MIRFDGYYSFEPILYQERKEWKPNYLNIAFLFTREGSLKEITKWSKSSKRLTFTKEDFHKNSDRICYKIDKKEIYYINDCKKDGYKFYLDIISPEVLKYRGDERIMKFVPWKEE